MSWQKKLAHIRAIAPQREDLVTVVDCAPSGAPTEFLDTLTARYPFLPADYLEFLRTCDGAQLDHCVLFGSGRHGFPSLGDLERRWTTEPGAEQFPFGEDSGGGALFISADVTVGLAEPQAPHEQRIIAGSFNEFLDEVLMGRQYAALFPYGPPTADPWLAFLQQQGWFPEE
jgi:hypothetical protein